MKRCRAITAVALSLYEDGVVEDPWEGLNTVPVPGKTEAPAVIAPAKAEKASKPAPAPVLQAVPDVEEAPVAKAAPVVAGDDYDYVPSDDELYEAAG